MNTVFKKSTPGREGVWPVKPEKNAADLRHALCHIGRNLRLRRDRIAKIAINTVKITNTHLNIF